MGNSQKKQQSIEKVKEEPTQISRNHFEFLYVIGRGGFGKVWKVSFKKNKSLYAMKEMFKAKVIDKRSERSIRYERELLSKMRHGFIVNMHYAFQDQAMLYLVMDLLTGGDLRYHISKTRRFNEEQTQFFVACILLALEYSHTNNVLHRDLKPENLVLDDKGYVRLTDYGIAKFYQKENSKETSGTPGYMSPEVMCAQNHTIAVDYYALGVIAFEFMFGFRPYTGKSRKEIKDKILAKQVQIRRSEIPEGWSVEAADFINRLLQRKPMNRLGIKGAQEVKEHAWLKYYPWKDLYDKKLESPFNPKIGDNFDSRYCNQPDKLGLETKERYENHMKEEAIKQVFKDFYFYYNENDPNDISNTKEKKFYNLHTSLINNKKNELLPNSSIDLSKNTSSSANFDSKINKIKQLSTSGSTSSIYNKAQQISSVNNNSTSGGTGSSLSHNGSSVFKKNNSVSNIRY